jgi:hypothetical protein
MLNKPLKNTTRNTTSFNIFKVRLGEERGRNEELFLLTK